MLVNLDELHVVLPKINHSSSYVIRKYTFKHITKYAAKKKKKNYAFSLYGLMCD